MKKSKIKCWISEGGLPSVLPSHLTVGLWATQPYRPSSKRPSMNFFRLNERFGIIDECVSIFQKTLRAMWGKNACENWNFNPKMQKCEFLSRVWTGDLWLPDWRLRPLGQPGWCLKVSKNGYINFKIILFCTILQFLGVFL